MKNPAAFLRVIALVEAVSWLLLLCVAMPLKYGFDMPTPVRVVGLVHGLLFLAFGWALLRTLVDLQWPMKRAALVFGASLVPVMPFFLDARMRAWAAAPPPAR